MSVRIVILYAMAVYVVLAMDNIVGGCVIFALACIADNIGQISTQSSSAAKQSSHHFWDKFLKW